MALRTLPYNSAPAGGFTAVRYFCYHGLMNKKTKPSWRFIPRPIFQGLALLLLLGLLYLTMIIVRHRAQPFRFLQALLGEGQWWLAVFLTFLILFLGWVLLVLSLRYFSQMPTYREELEAAEVRNLGELYQRQRQKLFLNETEAVTPAQQAIRSRGLAVGGLLTGFIAALATVLIYLILDAFWISGVVIAVLGFLLGSWHGLKSLRR